MTTIKPNLVSRPTAKTLQREMAWIASVVEARIAPYLSQSADPPPRPSFDLTPPPLPETGCRYSELLRTIKAGLAERLILALALAPHLAPHGLDLFLVKNAQLDRGFTEFGGVKGVHHAGFLPTGETALFLLAGTDLEQRLLHLDLFDPEHALWTQGALQLERAAPGEPFWSGGLAFSPAYLRHLLSGQELQPEQGTAFPARRISTNLTWDDLVIDPSIREELDEILAWATHRRELLEEWGLDRHVKPGFRALFHGPPGTGKSLTASLLGRELKVDVYRIDLSQVVSKYIGETEKNLATVFTEAAQRDWILFFDEADALFGKRTATSSAHDRYANQEVSYLLQRIEEHPGIVILATNLKSNLDDAFARRFQTMVYFAPPDVKQRQVLWEKIMGPKVRCAPEVNLKKLAHEHVTTGGQIVNVVRHACLAAAQRPQREVTLADLLNGIRREYRKEGRS